MAFNLPTFEQGLATWLLSSGLAAGRIVRRNDKTERPPHPYITYLLPFPRDGGVGPAEVRSSYEAIPDVLRRTVRGQREITCTIECFTYALVGGADPDGNQPAMYYLQKCRDALYLPSVIDNLYASGLVFISEESSNDLSSLLGEVGQGRAMFEARFRLTTTATEDIDYIETVVTPSEL